MLIPSFWAEASARHRAKGKQVTVRRFGWSLDSDEDAARNAQARADEALARVLAGEALVRREPKVSYNGADGVPIREQVLERHGDTVITRNLYGARCLNTPDVFFADIDFGAEPGRALRGVVVAVLVLAAAWWGKTYGGWWTAFGAMLVALTVAGAVARALVGLGLLAKGGQETVARRRVEAFVAAHPGWRLRLYRTPAGLRTLAMHRRFDPDDPEVAAFFDAVKADKLYVRMCRRQRCFRARISPKPWRAGVETHIKPRPGVWPVNPERLPEREDWIALYELMTLGYASCRHLADLGDGPVDAGVDAVRELHDEACRADTGLPLA
jgi:hypothetical protein